MITGGFGQPNAEQLDLLQHKNAQVIARQQIKYRISPATQLQNALKALGTATGDSTLSKLKVDGVIGPNTVKATNYAFATYLGAPNVMALAYVRQHVVYLAAQVTQYVESHGGVIPTPTSAQKALRALRMPVSFTPSSSVASSPLSVDGDNRWIWWTVGGGSVLLILALAASAMKKRRRTAEA
jgi:hypothetical protein